MMPNMNDSPTAEQNAKDQENGPINKMSTLSKANTAFNSIMSHKILDNLREKYEPFDEELFPILEKIRKMVEIGKEYNGWITMILIKGIDNTNNDMSNMLNNISVVSGLFMTVTLTGALAPPANIITLDNSDWVK